MTAFSDRPAEAQIRQTLSRALSGELLDQAVASLASAGLCGDAASVDVDGADVDLQRQSRCGFPEVIFGEGKSSRLILKIIAAQHDAGQDSFITRLRTGQARKILAKHDGAIWNKRARTVRIPHPDSSSDLRGGLACVVTAGSSDQPVAEEAIETLRWMRVECELLPDAGVAGPHRLQKHLPRLKAAAAIVCVAGMEAALPSVVAGYVSCPVIGVPTSVGYGASLNGITALLSMLTCCASNVVTVNIDAGFKGGYVAGMIASRTRRL